MPQEYKADQETRNQALPNWDEVLPGIPRKELLYYLEGAAKGLDFLNVDHDIQHGDVKPQNIMIISGEGQVSDFDFARTIVDVQATTTKVGTPAYMAPEVFEDGVPCDKRTSTRWPSPTTRCVRGSFLTGT